MSRRREQPNAAGRPSHKSELPDQTSTGYVPTCIESAAAQRYRDRRTARPAAARFNVAYDGETVTLTADHPDEKIGNLMLADQFATADPKFAGGLLDQLANVSRTGKKLTAREVNFMLSAVHAIGPRDETEALLAAQMVAIHNATMAAARQLNHTETINQQDSASNRLNKLARTFTAQLEALKRYRSTGEQNVCVTHQHVNVAAGQAVIGIGTGGAGAHEDASQSLAPRKSVPNEQRPALLGQEQALGLPVPSAGREGANCVPDAWRPSRSTDRIG